ncbi:MAG: peptidoglycan bridge formation glycyltransferase FemA/FemB family protein [Patescibacteria group bacterium]
MQIVNIKNKEHLDKFISSQEYSQFLQSWQWGEFQEKMGCKVIRLGVENNGQLVAAATLVKTPLLAGKSYFYCPRGPVVIADFRLPIADFLFDEIKKIARDEKVIFLRFESQSQIENLKSKIVKTIDVQPSKTLILDLSKSEDELLKNMHQKTRYNIRLAEKKGVKIVETQNIASKFEEFWKLMEQTVKRDNFRLHSKAYYKKMLEVDKKYVKLVVAQYNNKIIAGNIVTLFGNTVTYLHGASSDEYRNVMAPFLLQWHSIKLAKSLGYKYYDFYGIDEKKWPGVTRFKNGFGGESKEYPGAFDLVFENGWYFIYKFIRKIKRII